MSVLRNNPHHSTHSRTSTGSLIDDPLEDDPAAEIFEMDESTLLANDVDDHDDEYSNAHQQPAASKGLLGGLTTHTLGLILLLFVVFLWTMSNFLGSVRCLCSATEKDPC